MICTEQSNKTYFLSVRKRVDLFPEAKVVWTVISTKVVRSKLHWIRYWAKGSFLFTNILHFYLLICLNENSFEALKEHESSPKYCKILIISVNTWLQDIYWNLSHENGNYLLRININRYNYNNGMEECWSWAFCNIISFSFFFCNRTLDSIKPIGNSTFDELNARLLII